MGVRELKKKLNTRNYLCNRKRINRVIRELNGRMLFKLRWLLNTALVTFEKRPKLRKRERVMEISEGEGNRKCIGPEEYTGVFRLHHTGPYSSRGRNEDKNESS